MSEGMQSLPPSSLASHEGSESSLDSYGQPMLAIWHGCNFTWQHSLVAQLFPN